MLTTPNAGRKQQYLQVGNRFEFEYIDADGDKQIVPFGVIEDVINPNLEVAEAELKDGWGGKLTPVAKSVNSITETMEVQFANFDLSVLRFALLSGEAAEYSQASSAVTSGANQNIKVGGHAGCVNASGARVYNIASIDSVTLDPGGSDTALVAGTDYEVVSLQEGVIRVLATGTTGSADASIVVQVDYTPNAVSGKRLLRPQAEDSITGIGRVFYSADGGDTLFVRQASVSIAPSSSAFATEEFSKQTVMVTVLSDTTNSTEPAGYLLHAKGDVAE